MSAEPWEPDHELSPGAAAERIARVFPTLAGLPLVPLPEGWDFRTYALGGSWVVRIAKRRTESPRLEREWALLDRIAGDLPVATPRYVLRHAATEEEPWALGGYPRLPGAPLDAVVMDAERVARVAARWGEAIACLHAVPQDRVRDLGLPEPPFAGIVERRAQDAEEGVRALAGHVSDRLLRTCRARIAERCAEPTTFRLLHADLSAEHVLVETSVGELLAMLDWTDVEIGPPACDFAGLWAYAGDDALEAALDVYGSAGRDDLAAQARFFGLGFLLTAARYERRRGELAAVNRLIRCLVARMG